MHRCENKHINLYQTWIAGVTHKAIQISLLLMDIMLYNFSTYTVSWVVVHAMIVFDIMYVNDDCESAIILNCKTYYGSGL
jgi:hypothetical protein